MGVIPTKKSGDILYAKEVNVLSELVGQLAEAMLSSELTVPSEGDIIRAYNSLEITALPYMPVLIRNVENSGRFDLKPPRGIGDWSNLGVVVKGARPRECCLVKRSGILPICYNKQSIPAGLMRSRAEPHDRLLWGDRLTPVAPLIRLGGRTVAFPFTVYCEAGSFLVVNGSLSDEEELLRKAGWGWANWFSPGLAMVRKLSHRADHVKTRGGDVYQTAAAYRFGRSFVLNEISPGVVEVRPR